MDQVWKRLLNKRNTNSKDETIVYEDSEPLSRRSIIDQKSIYRTKKEDECQREEDTLIHFYSESDDGSNDQEKSDTIKMEKIRQQKKWYTDNS